MEIRDSGFLDNSSGRFRMEVLDNEGKLDVGGLKKERRLSNIDCIFSGAETFSLKRTPFSLDTISKGNRNIIDCALISKRALRW